MRKMREGEGRRGEQRRGGIPDEFYCLISDAGCIECASEGVA